MNPNHYLAAAIAYLFANRPGWSPAAAIGKTVVSSGIIDRVAAKLGRKLVEVPVGFKWFVDGLLDGSLGFGGEESAGAAFLRRDGTRLDHRQGRPDPRPARGRDHRRAPAGPGGAVSTASPPNSARPITSASTRPADGGARNPR